MPSLLSSLRNSLSASDGVNNPSTPSFDHKITLRDNTHAPAPPDRVSSTVNSTTHTTPVTSVFDLRPFSSHGTGGSSDDPHHRSGALRKAMARRKYSKWSAEAYNSKDANKDESAELDRNGEGGMKRDTKLKLNAIEQKLRDAKKKPNTSTYECPTETETDSDGPTRLDAMKAARRTATALTVDGQGTSPKRKGSKSSKKAKVTEIDILYENQRGMFMCGIPLFSANSLLNFDPTPWQTHDFKSSPVSILDKQCPDPTWVWEWKTWYVDMSSDVDDQGWTYSFSFNSYFSWHGTHVWFHSFVRRRRWLRKRVKLRHSTDPTLTGSNPADEGHRLNPDYFTIHSANKPRSRRGSDYSSWRQRGSIGMSGTAGGSSGGREEEVERAGMVAEEDEEILDVPKLLKVLRRCTLDREKTAAINRFLRDGGDEVMYLAERMPMLMSLLTFQASRRQLLGYLNAAYSSAEALHTRLLASPSPPQRPLSPQSPLSPFSSTPPTLLSPSYIEDYTASATTEISLESSARRMDALKLAIKSAEEEVKRLEFWSDIRDVTLEKGPLGQDVVGAGRTGGEREREREKGSESEGVALERMDSGLSSGSGRRSRKVDKGKARAL